MQSSQIFSWPWKISVFPDFSPDRGNQEKREANHGWQALKTWQSLEEEYKTVMSRTQV